MFTLRSVCQHWHMIFIFIILLVILLQFNIFFKNGAPQMVKKMHICIQISMCMCNKNVQVSSIHGEKMHICMRICMHMPFFPVYGRNLHIFITHVHTNAHTNVHFILPPVEPNTDVSRF